MTSDDGHVLASRLGYRVDYHVHTSFSLDSEASPSAVLSRAVEVGIDCLCVTDHNTIDGALAMRELAPPGIDIVVGCEFDTDDGQVIGLGLTEMISERRLLPLLLRIRDQGGLVMLPHPTRRAHGVFRPEIRRDQRFLDEVLANTDLVELFNGRDTFGTNAANESFVLSHGLPSIVGSDAHTPDEVGSVFVEYEAPGPVHGRARRALYYPTRAPAREHPVKRRIMESYHRNKGRLPGIVDQAYRTSHAVLRGRRRPGRPSIAVLQHVIPATTETAGHDA